MYSAHGQMWGFPVYDWSAMAGDGYGWWKARLAQAARFFHAFRIDHVLGFFRIWQVPATRGQRPARLVRPCRGVRPGRPRRRAASTTRRCAGSRCRTCRATTCGAARRATRTGSPFGTCSRIGAEDLYNLAPALDREDAIRALDEPEPVREALYRWHADRCAARPRAATALPRLAPRAVLSRSPVSTGPRQPAAGPLPRSAGRERGTWERRGRALLAMVGDASDMLVCAEDLGDVPDCVPRVLADLGILGLRIERWAREWKRPGSPFIPPREYPALTVCTPSVHDTSTLRGWWEEDRAEREAYFPLLELEGAVPRAARDRRRTRPSWSADSGRAPASACCSCRSCSTLTGALVARPARGPDQRARHGRGHQLDLAHAADVESLAARAGLADRLRAMIDGRRRRPRGGAVMAAAISWGFPVSRAARRRFDHDARLAVDSTGLADLRAARALAAKLGTSSRGPRRRRRW